VNVVNVERGERASVEHRNQVPSACSAPQLLCAKKQGEKWLLVGVCEIDRLQGAAAICLYSKYSE
jgi:hypothetical protein